MPAHSSAMYSVELDRMHERLSAFLTTELSAADWTLLKDASRYCITIVKTAYLGRLPTAVDGKVTELLPVLKDEPKYEVEDDPNGFSRDIGIEGLDNRVNDFPQLEERNEDTEAIHHHLEESLRDVKVLLTPLNDEDVGRTLVETTLKNGRKRPRKAKAVLIKENEKRRDKRAKVNAVPVSERRLTPTNVDDDANVDATNDDDVADVNEGNVDGDSDVDDDFDPSKDTHNSDSAPDDSDHSEDFFPRSKKKAGKISRRRKTSSQRGKMKKTYPSIYYRKIPGTTDYECLNPQCGKLFKSPGGCYLHHMKVHNHITISPRIKNKRCHLCSQVFHASCRLKW